MREIPSQTGRDWHHPNCFGCGEDNTRGLKADFRFDSETGEVRFEYIPDKFLEGAPGYTHGGILASLLDEAQGVLCFHLGHFVMTNELNINYIHAVPLDKPVVIRAWLTAVRKRRLHTRAEIVSAADGDILCKSRAKWYIMPERVYRRMFGDKMHLDEIALVLSENKKRTREIRKKLKEKKNRSGK